MRLTISRVLLRALRIWRKREKQAPGWLPICGVDETSTVTFAPQEKTASQSNAVLEIGPGIHDQ